MSTGPAPDGEEYLATALIFASTRRGDGEGIFEYGTEARNLLNAMATGGMFNRQYGMVTFGVNVGHTDPSYVLPAFYEVWACFDEWNRDFWSGAAGSGRWLLQHAVNPSTGLAPDQSGFDGSPTGSAGNFTYDARRVVVNVMMDHHFFQVDPWQITYAETLGAFWTNQGY